MSLPEGKRMYDARINKLAEVLVGYSIGVKRGELVSLVGPPVTEPLILALYREVLKAGGHPIVLMEPEACAETLYHYGNQKQLAYVSPLELCELEAVDVTIHCLASENPRALSRIEPARQAARSKARRPLMDTFLRRAAEKSLRWVATQFPCHAAAQDAETSLDDYADFVFAAGMLDKEDPADAWRTLSRQQARLVSFLQGVQELHFVTPSGTDLRVAVAGRSWINCDGHENFPDGEVFTGPIEDATEGTVCFDFPAVHGGREVQGVRLVFRAGRVVDASAAMRAAVPLSMREQHASARARGAVATAR